MRRTYESLWVYIVNNVVRVEVAERYGTASIEGHVDGVLRVGCRVEYVELVGVRVTVEVSLNRVPEAIQDTTVLPGPCNEACSSPDWDVSQDVDFFAGFFGFQEGIVQPLQLTAEVRWIV